MRSLHIRPFGPSIRIAAAVSLWLQMVLPLASMAQMQMQTGPQQTTPAPVQTPADASQNAPPDMPHVPPDMPQMGNPISGQDQNPSQDQTSDGMSGAVQVVPTAPPAAARPLNRDEQILHALNRFTYGPRPGELQQVREMGLGVWLTHQLNFWQIDDSALTKRLADYPAMQLPLTKLMEMYPSNNTVRAAMNNRAAVPRGEAEKAIYANQMERYKEKKKARDGNEDRDTDPKALPMDPQAILALEPAKRFALLCRLTVPQITLLRRRLPEDQRVHLTDGFSPQQVEALAAFSGPENLVTSELVQTKLLRDIYSERQLNELMVDFWLNHFNVYMRKNQEAPYYITAYERDAIRPRAMGRFENLLKATAMSPAMLSYLDNSESTGPHSEYATQRSRRGPRPQGAGLNENYAREVMELHTLGVNGGYTQHDVTEVAKVFTGWTVGKPRGVDEAAQAQFDPDKHEPGSKHVLGVTIKDNGASEGVQVLHLLATSPHTARFISTKLAVRFVSDNPPPAMIDRMTDAFLKTGGDIRHVLLAMIQSPEFFSREAYRAKVKTPQEYVLSAVRASGADVVSTGALAGVIGELGMPLYGMQTPQGYSMKSEAWNNTAALVSRMNFALALSTNRVTGVQENWQTLLGPEGKDLTAPQKDIVLERRLLHMDVSERTRATILAQLETDPAQQERNLRQIVAKGGRDPLTSLRIPRDRNAATTPDNESAIAAGLIFGSPEFQRR